MNQLILSTFFHSQQIRTVPPDAKDQQTGQSEIPIEIEPLEGSKLYHALPPMFDDNKVIYGFVTSNKELDARFSLTPDNNYGNRYIIMRESANHFITMFVSDDETKMNFIRFEKKEVIMLLKDAYHPNPEFIYK